MTILDFVINFITAVKADNVKRGKEYKGCHTVYSVLDGFNINEAIRQIFGADIKDVDALKRFPIEQINILLKSGKIVGHYARGGMMIYLIGDATMKPVKDVSALKARFGMTPPPIIAPIVKAGITSKAKQLHTQFNAPTISA